MSRDNMRGATRLGVLVPFTNTNLEPDMAMMRPPGVTLHTARMGGYDADEVPGVEQMHGLGAADLDEPLRLLQGVRPQVILYGCTSATLTHGPAFDRALADRISTDSGAATVTAAGALVAAVRALGVARIGFTSPYVAGINDRAVAFLADMGVETVARSEVEADLDNTGQGALTPDAVFALGKRADAPRAEALVLSCTDMRSAEVVAALEVAVGKPVICSNTAMVFAAGQALGLGPIPGFGVLLERMGQTDG